MATLEGTLTSGVKYARGTGGVGATKSFAYSGTTGNVSLSHVAIKLDFVPKIINVYYTTGTSYEGFSIYNNDGLKYEQANVKIGRTNSSSTSQTTYNIKANSVVVVGDNTYHIPIHQSTSENITWEAYGYPPN